MHDVGRRTSVRLSVLSALLAIACASSTANKPTTGKPKPSFESMVKGHTVHRGLFTLYEGTKELYAVVPDNLFGVELGMMAVRNQGSGGLLLRGMPIDNSVIRFDRVGRQIVISRVNTNFTADPKSPLKPAVDGNFADSPIYATDAIEAEGQPPGSFFKVRELFGAASVDLIHRKLPYTTDKKPSLAMIKVGADAAVVRVAYRLKKDRNRSVKDVDTWVRVGEPKRVADNQNLAALIDFHIFRLPKSDYEPRRSDPRVGGIAMTHKDYTGLDERSTSFRHALLRWHVQPKDPTASLSDAKNPIVFYMDKSIPPRWRPAVRESTLWWNDAFEAIGIRNAIEVRDPPNDPKFVHDSLDHTMIYWTLTDDLMFSGMAGSAYADPRTGQVLKGHVYLNAEFPAFSLRRYLVYAWWRAPQSNESPTAWKRRLRQDRPFQCAFGPSYSSQLAFARLMLKVRGHLATPEQELAFQEAAIKELVSHEIGHALGFHHNFKASLLRPQDDITKGAVTANPADRPVTASVMDYNPVYIPPRGDMSATYFIEGVGPYDRLLVEYMYRPLEHLPATERAQRLDAIARRAETAPGLAYDNGLLSSLDPTSNTDDLGDDPIAFSIERLKMIHEELLPNLPRLVLNETQDYALIRQALDAVVFSVALDYIDILARHVGGQILHRVSPGNDVAPVRVVPVADQRRALAALNALIFDAEAFPTPPALLNRLKADLQMDWNYPYRFGTNYDVNKRIEFVYEATLGTLLSSQRLSRIIDNEGRVPAGQVVFTVAELFDSLSRQAFSSLRRPRTINRRQRTLQRSLLKHYTRLATQKNTTPAAARQLAQRQIGLLKARVARARRSAGSDPYTVAHLDSLLRDLESASDVRTVVMP